MSLLDGALRWYGNVRKKNNAWQLGRMRAIAAHYGANLETPWMDLPEAMRQAIIYGSGEESIHFSFEAKVRARQLVTRGYPPPEGRRL